MLTKQVLMVPGPTTVPERVLQAMNRPVINHRGPQYEAMFKEVSEGLKVLFQTKYDVLTFPSAGTGMMEAAIVNYLSPQDKILVVSIGVFGDRVAEIAEQFGVVVEKLDFTWGQSADPAVLAERLALDTDETIKAVYLTQNETSTGVVNDIQKLAAACKNHSALVVVDAVSSLGAIDLKMDEWGIDVVITGAQKALMLPPGLGFMAINDKAWDRYRQSTLPKYYWDAEKTKKSLQKGQNPYTPPVSLVFGLQESLKIIAEEGMPQIFARHRLMAKAIRAAMKALKLELLADDKDASPAVTAILAPKGIEAKTIQKLLRNKYGITIAGGQKKLENKIFRIGHLGYTVPTDVLLVVSVLELVLTEIGFPVTLGMGVKAAQQTLLEGWTAI